MLIPLFLCFKVLLYFKNVFVPLYPYMIYGYSLDLPLSVIPMISLISINSYVLFFIPLLPLPIHMIEAVPPFHCDGHILASPP